jgi:signal transduction histidine kinase
MEQSPQRTSVLAIRLITWFILLSSVPTLVLVIFGRQNIQDAFVNFENSHHYEMAGMLAEQIALSDNTADAQRLLSKLEGSEQVAFILGRDGTYLAHVDARKINTTAEDDFSPDAVRTILTERDGLYSLPSNPNTLAFTPITGQDAVVVVAAKDSKISAVMRQLEGESYRELLISMLIILVGSGMAIWLVVGLPIRKLTHAAEQLSAGRLDVQVDSNVMVDDLRVLATTFNTMVNQIRELVENLEQHLVARTQELSAFFDLTMLTSSGQDLPEILEPAVNRILEVSHSQAICIHLLAEDNRGLRLVTHLNLPDDAEHRRLQLITLNGDFDRWFGQTSDPLITTKLAIDTVVPAELKLTGFQTYLGAQIRVKGHPQGVLSCFRHSARGFAVDEISLLVALAEQVGVIVENHRLRQRIQEMAVVEERQRLARDLHDSVTQSLYSLALFTRAGREAAEDGDTPRLNDSLAALETTALQALRQMRLLLYELRPAVLEQEGLVRALDLRFDTVERRAGIQVDYQIEGNIDLPQPVETELYHITIEALNNTLKHAGASRVSACLCSRHNSFELKIADDGCGFDPAQAHRGLGLRSILERVERLGGSLEILSAPGAGTQVLVNITDQMP